MNAKLLKDSKHQHERTGSRTSRGPSRQPSMASLGAHSPNSQGMFFIVLMEINLRNSKSIIIYVSVFAKI